MLIRVLIGGLIGGLVGFGIGYFGRCVSGMCPLTSNPIISATIGVILGVLISSQK
ncbi:DUF6132 family protein [Candidatus Omnitrophota bacterium]